MNNCPFLESTKVLASTGKWCGCEGKKFPASHVLILLATALFVAKITFILLYLTRRKSS